MSDPTDLTKYPKGSSSFVPAQRNASDLDKLILGNETVENRAGTNLLSYQQLANQFTTESPVTYTAGLLIERVTQRVEYSGFIYAPRQTSLPFTTSGTWVGDDEDNFYVASMTDDGTRLAANRSINVYEFSTLTGTTNADAKHAIENDVIDLSVSDVLVVYGLNSLSDGGAATYKCTTVTATSKTAGFETSTGIYYVDIGSGNFAGFENINDVKKEDQYGAYLSQITKMRSGERFSLAQAVSESDYEAILAKTNTDDQSDLINNVLGDATNLFVPKGRWYAGDLQPQSDSVFEGAGWGAYSSGRDGNTAFYLPSGKTGFMDFAGVNNLTLNNFTVNAQNNGDGFYTDGGGNHFYLDQIKVYNAGACVRGNGGNPLSDLHTTRCVFRESNKAVEYVQDSSFTANTTFSAINFRGMLLEGGQIRIVDCFFEFMHNNKNAVNAIETFGNLNELTVSSCQFDRIAGNSIKFGSGAANNARHVNILGNQFKRGCWGENLPLNQQYDILQVAGTVEDLVIDDSNIWERGNHGASSITGKVSPAGAYYLPNVVRATIGKTHTQDLEEFVYSDKDPSGAFTQSTGNANEYYRNVDYDTRPDVVRLDGSGLAEGTVGSLSTGEWGWGNNDSLARNRIYVRAAGDVDPNTLSSLIIARDFKQTYIDGTNEQAAGYRDFAFVATLNNGGTTTLTMRTRTSLIDNFERTFAGALEILGWEQGDGVAQAGSHRFNFTLSRTSGTSITISEGTVEALNSSGFGAGWASGGTGALRVTINPTLGETDPNGNLIKVKLDGFSASGLRDLKVRLRW